MTDRVRDIVSAIRLAEVATRDLREGAELEEARAYLDRRLRHYQAAIRIVEGVGKLGARCVHTTWAEPVHACTTCLLARAADLISEVDP